MNYNLASPTLQEHNPLNNRTQIKRALLAMMTLCVTLQTHATITKFFLEANTPTTLTVPSNQTAFVQYNLSNNTKLTRSLTLANSLPPGMIQLTSDSKQCPKPPFTLVSHSSCLLTFLLDGSQIQSSIQMLPKICKTKGTSNAPDYLLCSEAIPEEALSVTVTSPIQNKQVAYVSNWLANSVSRCFVNALTHKLEHCNVSAINGPLSLPEAVATNASVTLLYVANVGGSVAVCHINAYTGDLSGCKDTGTGFHAPSGVVIDSTNSHALVANITSNSVSTCTINATTGELSGCYQTGSNFSMTSDIAMNPAKTYAYAGNFSQNSVTICTYTADTGVLSNCVETGALFSNPEGVAINSAGTFAYVTNYGNHTISLCPLQNGGASFGTCTTTDGTFQGFGNLAFNEEGSIAYVPSSLIALSMCAVDAATGQLSNCSTAGLDFKTPSGVLLTTLPT